MFPEKSIPTEAKPTSFKALDRRAEPQKTSNAGIWVASQALVVDEPGGGAERLGCFLEAPVCSSLMVLLACQYLLRNWQMRGSLCLPSLANFSSKRSKSDSSDKDIVGESGEAERLGDAVSRCRCGEGEREVGECTIVAVALLCAWSVPAALWKTGLNLGDVDCGATECKEG